MKTNILILPSWYASPEAPTSGSFFREQSLLLEDTNFGQNKWNVTVLTSEKVWISKQRSLYYRFFPNKQTFNFSNQHVQPPTGYVVHYPFCKFENDALNLKREIEGYLRFFEKYPERKPAIIHAHSTLKGGIIAHHLAKLMQVPYIITEHLNPFLLHQYSDFWKEKIIAALTNSNKVLAVSDYQRQQILSHEISCNPITIGNLVDDVRFQLIEKQSKETCNYLIVTYYPNFIKDMDTFFNALHLLKEANQIANKHFTIVGGGELKGQYQENFYTQRIKELNLNNWVSVVPSANRDEMVQLMQQTDALISTSIAETFGVAICEAMLCGKPVITTLNGGVNDYAQDFNAITVPIRDPQALKKAILKYEEEKKRFDRKKIRTFIEQKYGRKAFRERMEKIYLSVLEK